MAAAFPQELRCLPSILTPQFRTLCSVSIAAEQFLRLLLACGLPPTDVDLVHGKGAAVGQILVEAEPRNTLFTGSRRVAEKLAADLHGKVRADAIQ